LRLRKLDRLDAPIDARQRGTAIHAALETFEESGREKSSDALLDLLENELRKAGQGEDEILSARAVHHRTIEWYLANWRAARTDDVQQIWLEVDGTTDFTFGDDIFTLSAQADRIELNKDGTLSIVDFKTGSPPSDKAINAGLEQQMPLQGVIAETGGFAGVPAKQVHALEYVAFKAAAKAAIVKPKDKSLGDLIIDARAGLQTLLDGYARAEQPYLSVPRIQFISKYAGDFDRLARRAEWAGEVSDE
jgi:ATP-dependent helicase/nuclease subunit B